MNTSTAPHAEAFFSFIVERNTEAALDALRVSPSLAAAHDRGLGSTPLHFAAHRGLAEIVSALLEAGADVHAREAASGTTPLHWAAEGGHPAIAALLIAHGARLDLVDDWYALEPLGWTSVVQWAAHFHGDRPAIRSYLLAQGARLDPFTAVVIEDVTALDRLLTTDPNLLGRRLGFVGQGMSPLHLAISQERSHAAQRLLAAGAAPNARTDWGLTPLALARMQGNAALVDLLRRHGAIDDLSSTAATNDIAQLAAQPGMFPLDDAQQDLYERLLFVAARHGWTASLTHLLRCGASPNRQLKHLLGEKPAMITPLHLAAQHGHAAAARALLNAGADPDPGAAAGQPTPLHLSAGAGHRDTVAVLLEHGANPHAKDNTYDATPLDWAEFGGHADTIALLQNRA